MISVGARLVRNKKVGCARCYDVNHFESLRR
jgi:hypothetical protein